MVMKSEIGLPQGDPSADFGCTSQVNMIGPTSVGVDS